MGISIREDLSCCGDLESDARHDVDRHLEADEGFDFCSSTVSSREGQFEVFVVAYPGPGRRWQVSSSGGGRPQWASRGHEIVYRSGNRLMSVAVTTAPSFQATPAREIVKLPDENFDLNQLEIAPDGQRFLLVRPDDWQTEYRRRPMNPRVVEQTPDERAHP
jgi:hypothetical protein